MVARSQPFDDGGLRETLLSADCQHPCFMEIRPGVTTEVQALRLLQASPWVAQIAPLVSEGGFTWTWNGRQPTFLQGGFASNSLLTVGGIVTRIDLFTSENLATFLLGFGLPDAWSSETWFINDLQSNNLRTNFGQSIFYNKYPMEVVTQGGCPLSVRVQWALPVQISLSAQQNRVGYDSYDHTPLVAISRLESCQ